LSLAVLRVMDWETARQMVGVYMPLFRSPPERSWSYTSVVTLLKRPAALTAARAPAKAMVSITATAAGERRMFGKAAIR
jgi:hypothetical protein